MASLASTLKTGMPNSAYSVRRSTPAVVPGSACSLPDTESEVCGAPQSRRRGDNPPCLWVGFEFAGADQCGRLCVRQQRSHRRDRGRRQLCCRPCPRSSCPCARCARPAPGTPESPGHSRRGRSRSRSLQLPRRSLVPASRASAGRSPYTFPVGRAADTRENRFAPSAVLGAFAGFLVGM